MCTFVRTQKTTVLKEKLVVYKHVEFFVDQINIEGKKTTVPSFYSPYTSFFEYDVNQVMKAELSFQKVLRASSSLSNLEAYSLFDNIERMEAEYCFVAEKLPEAYVVETGFHASRSIKRLGHPRNTKDHIGQFVFPAGAEIIDGVSDLIVGNQIVFDGIVHPDEITKALGHNPWSAYKMKDRIRAHATATKAFNALEKASNVRKKKVLRNQKA